MSRSTEDRKARGVRAVDEQVVDEEAREMPELLAAVNASIHGLAAGRLGGAGLDMWEFRCECGAPTCNEVVSLAVAAYEALRDSGRAVLADGHSSRGDEARAKSRKLRDDATALTAQARQQVRRSLRFRQS